MELFDSRQTTETVVHQEQTIASPEPVYSENNPQSPQSEEGQSLLQTIIMIAAGIILVILLVLFARWLYHKVHHTAKITNTGSQSQPAPSYPAPSSQPGANSQQPSTNNPSASGTTNTQANGLPNSGPGNVAAIFAASTLAAAGIHYIASLRRFAGNKQ